MLLFMGSYTKNETCMPYARIAMDLGSDGNSGYHALERKFGLNMDQAGDQNHNLQNGWKQMEADFGATAMMALNCVRFNVPHGPRKGDELRRHQLRGVMDKIYLRHPSELPTFGQHGGDILRTLDALNIDLPGRETKELEAFRYLGANFSLRSSGRRVHMCRFNAMPYALVKKNQVWSIDEFELKCLCLEEDWLASRKLVKVISDKTAAAADDKVPMKEPGADEKMIRSVSRSAPFIGFQMTTVLKGSCFFCYLCTDFSFWIAMGK